MRRIVVGIPTFEEAETIAHVVRCADAGLHLVEEQCGPIRAKIVNSDSLSADGTARIFARQTTSFPKQQVSTGGDPGKGKNVRRLLDIAAEFEADCLLLLDGDLYSIRPEWLPKLILPVLRDGADFVSPRYRRSRYEGGITNHLCVPLIHSVFGRCVRQPIAGDFCLSRAFVDRARRAAWPDAANYYGVDITLTITAIESSSRMAEARLDQKVHKPVIVPKFCWTFAQVCEAALSLLRGAAVAGRADSFSAAGEAFTDNVAFPFDETTAILLGMADEKFREWRESHDIERYGMGRAVQGMLESARGGVPLEADLYAEHWCEAVTLAIRAAMSGANAAAPMTALLLPAFLVKMCSFWAKVRAWPTGDVEAEVVSLAERVRCNLAADFAIARS